MTLKEILDAVMFESGMGTEVAYAGAQRDAVKRLVALANRSADYLATCHGWQALRRVGTVLPVDGQDAYDLPPDLHELVPETTYSQNYYMTVDVRTAPSEWRYIKSNNISTGPRIRARILDNKLEINKPDAGQEITFEYVSKWPVLDGTTRKQRFTLDTDEWLLDDDMLIMDILWRYMRLIGKPEYTEARLDATRRKIEAMGTEAGEKTILPGEYDYPAGEPYTNLWITD